MATPVPIGDSWTGIEYLRVLCHIFPISSHQYTGKVCCGITQRHLWLPCSGKHCFPITTPASYMLWHVLVCRKPNNRHPTQRWERSGLNHKEVEILYIVTVQQQIQALNTISIFILTCSRTMGESFSSLESRTKLFTDLTRIGRYLTF